MQEILHSFSGLLLGPLLPADLSALRNLPDFSHLALVMPSLYLGIWQTGYYFAHGCLKIASFACFISLN